MRLIDRITTLCSFLILFIALGIEPGIAASRAAATPAQKPANIPAAADWQKKWDDTVAAAKKEGKVVVYFTAGTAVRNALIGGMAKEYGISVEIVTGRGAELVNKITAERRAGMYNADVYQGGITSLLSQWKPAGFLDPLAPALILPKVLDKKAWLGGELPYIDKDRYVIGFSAGVPIYVAINTDLVKKEEITAYADLLNPKWKGKMALFDPTVGAGSSTAWLRRLMLPEEMGREKAIQFMKDLVKQEPAVTKDLRQQVEWVARGKYAIAIGPQREQVSELRKAGAPILPITYFKEGIDVSPGSGGVALVNKAAHPNAARVFINWLLSKEGQTLYAQGYAAPSARIDVSTEGLDPAIVPDPKKKYVRLGEETFLADPETEKLLSEIFGPLTR